mmetsp:Transcript_4845/g.5900  ORF Transcript_4845/g.5900 Transcript_4845/m.5900 type:complete len:370 (-) Transcript_4845:133-1242(-)
MPRGKASKAKKKSGSQIPDTVEGMLSMLANMHNMDPAKLMKLQMELDDPSKVPPFPASKVKRCLSRMSEITSYEDIRDKDAHQLQCWCKEDFYMESIFDAGVVPVLTLILQLSSDFASKRVANNTKTPITEEQTRIRELTLYSIADGLLNENNKKKTDLSEVVPLLISIILQEGDIHRGFPVKVTAMNYAIKALGECFRALAVQRQEATAIGIIENTTLLETICKYIRDDKIITPIGMKVSSLLCSLRFVQMLATTSHRAAHIMTALGYYDAIKGIARTDPQTNLLIESTLSSFEGREPKFEKPIPEEAIGCHTKSQLRRLCAYCGIEEDPANPHKKCSRCKKQHYCSRDCQVAHWKGGHSKECASMSK